MKKIELKSLKSKIFSILVICILSIVLIITLKSCSKNDNNSIPSNNFFDNMNENEVLKVKSYFGLDIINIDQRKDLKNELINSLNVKSEYYKRYTNLLDTTNIIMFANSDENNYIAFFYFKNKTKTFLAVKGFLLDNKFLLDKELLYSEKFLNKSNYEIFIVNRDEGILIKHYNGFENIESIESVEKIYKIIQVNDCQGNHGGTGFCQREAGETFANCYRAESDEFCTDFFSCMALEYHPGIKLLIALSCQCGAAECVQTPR